MAINWKSLVLTAILTAFTSTVSLANEVLLIVDSSASMQKRTTDGVLRIEAAKDAFRSLTPALSGQEVGLIVFGHRVPANKAGCCDDLEKVIPIGPFSSQQFNDSVMGLHPLGNTPLAQSLLTAKDMLLERGAASPESRDVPKVIVVLTDGNETCHGNPQGAAAELRKLGIDVRIHVVGFAVQRRDEVQLRQIATAGGGVYVRAKDAAGLHEEMQRVVELAKVEVAPVAAPPRSVALSPIGKALVARLKDEDANLRNTAAKSLQKLKIVAAVPHLIERVLDETFNTYQAGYAKTAALQAIAAMAPEQVQATLLKSLNNKNSNIRNWTIAQLEQYGGPASGATLNAVDRALVECLVDENANVRFHSSELLQTRKAAAAAPFLVRRILDETFDTYQGGYAKTAALRALQALAPEQVEVTLLKAMESKNASIRDWSTQKLVDISQ